jgi:ABC-type uncharacterized transport system permease subunit
MFAISAPTVAGQAQGFVSKKDRIEKAVTGRIFSRQVYVVFSINLGIMIQISAQDCLQFLTAAS